MQESCEKNIILFILINIGCKVREKRICAIYCLEDAAEPLWDAAIWDMGKGEEGDICGIDFVCEGMRLLGDEAIRLWGEEGLKI